MLKLIFATLLVAFTIPSFAQNFSAIFQPSDAEVHTITKMGWENFLAETNSMTQKGFRLTDLETFKEGGDDRSFIGTYTKSPLEGVVEMAEGWTAFIKLKRKKVKEGFTMIDIAAVTLNESDVNFYGVWVKEDNPTIHKVWLLDSRETIEKKTKDMAKSRFKIKRVHVIDVPNGEPSFVVLYHFSPIDRFNFLYFADTMEEFEKEYNERKGSDVELIDFDRFRTGNHIRYVAIFQDGAYESAFLTNQPFADILTKSDSLATNAGLKLINLSVD
ncbi:hypothetical protein FUA23_08795 [Neolewinella aurantiaca]|uniref:Uncharacterized protein n=1 Tax=Neolewinella aurantiaca TaxID=2602767 RepID=A0A5C7FFW3_9BACT|nr:hypothetical protein [Neolewinella aurantiaca]TXF89775.1 hypothetical protein FUA23_08795 [Neolewinella aurantiaca]